MNIYLIILAHISVNTYLVDKHLSYLVLSESFLSSSLLLFYKALFVSPEDLPIFADHLLPNFFPSILLVKWIDFILYSALTLFRPCYLTLNGQRFSLWLNSFLIVVKQRQNLTFYLFLSVQLSGIKYIHSLCIVV